ncbi:MAG: V-type ATP synthase subunit D [Acidimicrobiales bacterium]
MSCTFPEPPAVYTTAAMAPTIEAHRQALRTAAEHAAMSSALERLQSELVATRRRRRAIEDRLIPDLAAERQALEIHLDEEDRDQALRVRLAARQQTGVAT